MKSAMPSKLLTHNQFAQTVSGLRHADASYELGEHDHQAAMFSGGGRAAEIVALTKPRNLNLRAKP